MALYSYKLIVAYDGTDYHGWQWQGDLPSIQQTLHKTFLQVFHQTEVLLVGASRTDAGVHAVGQVVRIRTILNIPPEKMKRVWNAILPSDITILSIEHVDDEFHPQHSVRMKTYEYTFFTSRPDSFNHRFGWHFKLKIDFAKLPRMLSVFVGTHDFRAFCKEETEKDTLKTIDSIALEHGPVAGSYKIIIKGKSFLRYMIRRIVGLSLGAAARPLVTENELKRALLEKKIVKSLPTASAKGLCLKSIEYMEKG